MRALQILIKNRMNHPTMNHSQWPLYFLIKCIFFLAFKTKTVFFVYVFLLLLKVSLTFVKKN